MHPIAFHASLHRWQLFVTLTYNSRDKRGNALKVPREVERNKMLHAFIHQVAKGRKKDAHGRAIERVPSSFLRWIAREERGERGGRYHWHILLEGLPPTRVNDSERFVIKTIWNDIGGGYADVRAFNSRLSGVLYVMKGLEGWSQSHANAYEVGKFGDDHKDRRLILSTSCVSHWGARSRDIGASGGALNPISSGVRSVGGREAAIGRLKETTEQELRRSIGLSMHPAGVSFIR
jgi:hypothetical protein